MKAPKHRRPRKVTAWKQARALFESWRKTNAQVKVELRRPRVIDIVPIDFLRGEPVGPAAGSPTRSFHGRLIYHTPDDITIRRPSGAILIIDNYEIQSISDARTCFAPTPRG